jgi:hypothetical protein
MLFNAIFTVIFMVMALALQVVGNYDKATYFLVFAFLNMYLYREDMKKGAE